MYFCPSKVVLILANSADPNEMQHYAAFHLGLHCLPKYLFRGFQNTKREWGWGLKIVFLEIVHLVGTGHSKLVANLSLVLWLTVAVPL